MSLRLRLLAILGLGLVALWSVVAAWMLLDLRQEMRVAMDDRLAASARMVAGLVTQLPASAGAPALEPRSTALDVVARDGLACEVSLMRGEVRLQTLARTAGSPPLETTGPGYGTHEYGGKPWRTYVLEQNGIRVVTADRIDLRDRLLRDVALSAGIPFLVALLGSLPLLSLGIRRGLQPIERIRTALARRRPDDTAPLESVGTPPELRPLVGTIDHLLERVRETVARERRFTDDAAHELRTPLTAIKTHLQVAQLAAKQPGADAVVGEALGQAEVGVLRFQRTLEHLLLLARLDGAGGVPTDAEGDARASAAGDNVADAGRAARQAVADARLRDAASVPMAVTGDGLALRVRVPETLLVLGLRNLLDNALRHGGGGGRVALHVAAAASGQVAFSVRDDGPGMSEADCAQAVQRFWRRSNNTGGSGLGLSIVAALAERHGGALQLRNRDGGGFDATLTLPAEPAPKA